MSDYTQAIEQAKINLADVRARGNDALGGTWDELRAELFTPEENAASDLRAEMMLQIALARRELGITQKKLEELSGVKQPIIARMEKGSTKPQLDTILKVLAPLGKTLYIGDLPTAKA
ncbi:MAG: helix-turn-helix domain-containing protein [Defluviitaleaceae bacterium]|nr:helix-turn-helix domain-containing protein [Defluviitaleaceae bacterium]